MIKKIFLISLVVLTLSGKAFGQFIDKPEPNINKSTNLILGFIDPNKFSMKHSFKISMLGSQFGNVAMTSYINSMAYRFSDKLMVSADVSLNYSPYANSVFGKDYSNRLQQDITGINLSRLSLDYKISDNAYISFEYRNLKNEMMDRYWNPYSGYNDPFYGR